MLATNENICEQKKKRFSSLDYSQTMAQAVIRTSLMSVCVQLLIPYISLEFVHNVFC